MDDPLWSRAHVHLIGIGGSGMAGLASLLLAMGKRVSGCDLRPLAAIGHEATAAALFSGHHPAHLAGADLVVVSAAVPPDNVELLEARRRGLPLLTHAQALGLLSRRHRTIAVAGTHGKSTTTALIGYLLAAAGLDPTIACGARMRNTGTSARLGRGGIMVVEADEYAGRFLELSPQIAVVTSVEPDHFDCYPDRASLQRAFADFLARLPGQGTAVLCAGDDGARSLPTPARRILYGGDSPWQLRAYRPLPGGSRFRVIAPQGEQEMETTLAGPHMAANVVAACVVADLFGLGLQRVAALLPGFSGTARRFEVVAEVGGVRVVDDYAHHPTAVRAVLAAARERAAGRLWVIFQPHSGERTAGLLAEFAGAFAAADGLALPPTYEPAGRERGGPRADSVALAQTIAQPAPHLVGSLEEAAAWAARQARSGDWVLTLGAGDVHRAAALVREHLLAGAAA